MQYEGGGKNASGKKEEVGVCGHQPGYMTTPEPGKGGTDSPLESLVGAQPSRHLILAQ